MGAALPAIVLACAFVGGGSATAQVTLRVSVDSSGTQANYWSSSPSISKDGRVVSFISYATNLVTGDTLGFVDILVHDLSTGTTERVSVDSSGAEANDGSYSSSISADGSIVAFDSYASNLVGGDNNNTSDVFVHDRTTGITELVSLNSRGFQANDHCGGCSISADGDVVTFSSYATNLVTGDTNATIDGFFRERILGSTER